MEAYLDNIGKTGRQVAFVTSAEANEESLEDPKWGEGHGVFTHFLLEGMRGKADRQRPFDLITLGELFDYVRDEVIRETAGRQHPTVGSSSFDRGFPVAIIGGIAARQHFELGRRLFDLGQRLDEDRLLHAAAEHLSMANQPKQALLIGIDDYTHSAVDDLQGAVNDVRAWQHTLVKTLGFAPGNVKMLINAEAARATILTEFRRLVELS